MAQYYCHGWTDKEVAQAIGKPVWTVKTHKKKIFSKLGINTTHEMCIYCIAYFLNIDWSPQKVKEQGLLIFL